MLIDPSKATMQLLRRESFVTLHAWHMIESVLWRSLTKTRTSHLWCIYGIVTVIAAFGHKEH